MSRKLTAVIIFIVALVMYILTLAPSLGSSEGSSWIVNGMYAGLPAAPGNLFYLLMCSLMAKLYEWGVAPVIIGVAYVADAFGMILRPSLEPAVGINLISAISMAVSAALGFTLLDRLQERLSFDKPWPEAAGRWLLALGSMFLFTLPLVWRLAVTANPYSFNLLLIILMFWLLVRCEEDPSRAGTRMLILAFLAGLSFSQNMVFLLLVVMMFGFARQGKIVWPAFKANLGPAIGLFVVGCSLYLYLWLRPQAVPGLGDPIQLFTAEFWRYLFNVPAFENALPRNGNLLTDQIPLLTGRLKLQGDTLIAGVLLLILFHFGMIYHIRKSKGDRLLVLSVLAVAMLVPLWFFNPSIINSGGMDKHLLLMILLMGAWAVTGAVLLYRMAIQWSRKFQARMEFTTRRFERLVTVSSYLLLLGALLAPFYPRWLQADMSDYFLIRDLGLNQLQGVEENGILVLSGSGEYYRALYADKVFYGESQRSLINYQALGSKRYLRQLKRNEPPVPMDLEDSGIENLRPVRLEKPEIFQAGELKVNYPAETVFLVPDMALMSILRANKFERPVYFSYSVMPENMLGLAGYSAMRGLGVRLFEQDPLSGEDSTNYFRGRFSPLAVDIPWSQQLLWGYYVHRTTLWQATADKHDERFRPLLSYARAHASLAEALMGRENGEAAASNFRQCEFFDPDYETKLFNFATRLAQEGLYEQSKDFAGMYFTHVPPDPLPWAGLAKLALTNADTIPATELLIKSLEADPDFLLGYQKLIRLYNSMEKHTMVSAFLSRWLARHPTDEQTRQLWDEYNATQTLPPGFTP